MKTPASLPRLLLERLSEGELTLAGIRRLRPDLPDEEAIEEELKALRLELEESRGRLPPLRRVPRPNRTPRISRWWPALALAMGAAFLVARETTAPVTAEEGRLKGEPQLRVYRQTAASGGAERLQPGDVVHTGDVLQLSMVPRGRRHRAIVAFDGSGSVALLFPERGSTTALPEVTEERLPFALRLDAAPSFERHVFVTSEAAFDTDALLRMAEGLQPADAAPPPLPASLHQSSITLRKSSP